MVQVAGRHLWVSFFIYLRQWKSYITHLWWDF